MNRLITMLKGSLKKKRNVKYHGWKRCVYFAPHLEIGETEKGRLTLLMNGYMHVKSILITGSLMMFPVTRGSDLTLRENQM